MSEILQKIVDYRNYETYYLEKDIILMLPGNKNKGVCSRVNDE